MRKILSRAVTASLTSAIYVGMFVPFFRTGPRAKPVSAFDAYSMTRTWRRRASTKKNLAMGEIASWSYYICININNARGVELSSDKEQLECNSEGLVALEMTDLCEGEPARIL